MNNKFEYKILERENHLCSDSPDSDELDLILKEEPIIDELNRLGWAGWELVCILQEYNKLIYYFKKEKMW